MNTQATRRKAHVQVKTPQIVQNEIFDLIPDSDTGNAEAEIFMKYPKLMKAMPKIGGARSADPVERARDRFLKDAEEMKELIRHGEPNGSWFEKMHDGSYVVNPKNGSTHIFRKNRILTIDPIECLDKLIVEVRSGVLDGLFASTNRMKVHRM